MLEALRNYLEKRCSVSDSEYIRPNRLLKFSMDGKHYLAECDHEFDTVFFRIMLPIVEKAGDEPNSDVMSRMINISSSYKVGKALLIRENVWLSAELFIVDKHNVYTLFDRLINVLNAMYEEYKQKCHGSVQ